MATAFKRGHEIYYDWNSGDWYYCDSRESIDIERECVRCGKMPTPEGYDACLGYLPGYSSVCCGHGKQKPIIIKIKRKENMMDTKWENCSPQERNLRIQILELEYKRARFLARPSIMLGLIPVKDGDAWCVVYGRDMGEGVVGSGDTPENAMLSFDEAWDQVEASEKA